MKFAVMTGLLSLLCSVCAVAAGPTDAYVAREHVLGRVFMSEAERRQLDVLRKTRGAVETPDKVNSPVATAQATNTSTTQPSGYIVPSNGSPYQWIDGDFRRVAKIEANAADDSQIVRIARVKADAGDGDDSSRDQQPAMESDDENRTPH